MENGGNKNNTRVIGLDLGGTKLAAASFVSTEGGGIVFECALENRKYDSIFGDVDRDELTAQGKSKLIEAAMIGAVRDLSAGSGDDINGIGICSAGFVEDGYIVEAWNTGMENHPLQKNIEEKTGLRTFLYKDSWAPVFALAPDEPTIIFSIGTGFGGVSCDPGMKIPIRSYTANRRFKWIPFLYCNDDPGYAISFSRDDIAGIIDSVIRDMRDNVAECDVPESLPGPADLAITIMEAAKKAGRMTPSKLELFVAKGLAFRAMERMWPDEVFADFPGGAAFPGLLYTAVTKKEMLPHKLDKLLVDGNPAARAAFLIHAEFIGRILYEMQKERLEMNLPPAEHVYATGSGYNEVNHEILSGAIAAAMTRRCMEENLDAPRIESVRLIRPENIPTTFACLGAAAGAAMGIE